MAIMTDRNVITGFWSGETLHQKLPELVEPFTMENIDCAAYTLTIGHEVYISPSDQIPDPQSPLKGSWLTARHSPFLLASLLF